MLINSTTDKNQFIAAKNSSISNCTVWLNLKAMLGSAAVDTRTLWRQHSCCCSSLPDASSLQSVCEQRRITAAAADAAASIQKRSSCSLPQMKAPQEERMGPDAPVGSERRSTLGELGSTWAVIEADWCLGRQQVFSSLESEAEGTSIGELCRAGTVMVLFHLLANWQPTIYWFRCAAFTASDDTEAKYGQCIVLAFYIRK